MMKISAQTLWLGLALCASVAAHAQVYKCPDPANNRTVYSDRPCTGGGVQLERKRSQAEIEYDRQKAAAEYQKFQTRQRIDEARRQQEESVQYRPSPSTPQATMAEQQDCRTAKRESEAARSIKTGTDEYRARQVEFAQMREASACKQKYTPQRQPTHRDQVLVGDLPDPIHPCDIGGACLGAVSGMRYTRTSENHFWRQDGKSCSGSDTAVICP